MLVREAKHSKLLLAQLIPWRTLEKESPTAEQNSPAKIEIHNRAQYDHWWEPWSDRICRGNNRRRDLGCYWCIALFWKQFPQNLSAHALGYGVNEANASFKLLIPYEQACDICLDRFF